MSRNAEKLENDGEKSLHIDGMIFLLQYITKTTSQEWPKLAPLSGSKYSRGSLNILTVLVFSKKFGIPKEVCSSLIFLQYSSSIFWQINEGVGRLRLALSSITLFLRMKRLKSNNFVKFDD